MMRRDTSGVRGGIRFVRRAVLCLLLGLITIGAGDVLAQDRTGVSVQKEEEVERFHIVERGAAGADVVRVPWPVEVGMPGRIAGWNAQLLRWYQARAFFSARVDSMDERLRTVWVSKGAETVIGSINVREKTPVSDEQDADEARLASLLEDWQGMAASQEHLENLAVAVLTELSRQGYLAAQVSIAELTIGSAGLEVTLDLERGQPTRFSGVVLEGDRRTKPGIVASALGLRIGQTLENIRFELIRTDLAALGWHDAVFEPRFELTSDSTAAIVMPVTPLSPGQFDLVVGALPPSGDAGATVIGSGHLELTNAFGRGRMLEARVNRLPGQASSALMAIETPAPRGWPFVLHVGLQGHQQDSTWNQTSFSSKVLFRIDRGTWIGGTYAAERTRSGISGGVFEGAHQLVPRASMQLGGMTLRIQRLDHPRFPRQGFYVESVLERGLRSTRTREISGGDTLSVRRSERRERLTMDLDVFLMNGSRLGWAAGVDVSAVRAGRPDISELLFLGGASSLRGYDENRFQGTTVGRAFLEARWYVDRATWGFLFFDAGWVAVDADFEDGLPALITRSEGYHPGYGLGFVFSSAVGPISLSYALNPDESLRTGRVHLGLSFGL